MELPATERPPDDVIEDDEAFDRWYAAWTRDTADKARKAKAARR